jgi:hypothetical protein
VVLAAAVPAIDHLLGTAVSQPEEQGVENQFHRDLLSTDLVYNATFVKSRLLSGSYQLNLWLSIRLLL